MATNEILAFCPTDTGTNLLTQAEYVAEADRVSGNKPGIAKSKLVNKALKQSSLVAAALGKYIADNQSTDVTDDLTVDELEALIASAIQANIATVTSAVQGSFKNLTASATGTNANVSVACDQIILKDSGTGYKSVSGVSLTISISASGANGLDTGTSAGSTWYSVWVISNGTTTSGLLSTSTTSPTMPSGYTFKARVGWIRTDATANKYPLKFIQVGNRVNYVSTAATNVTKLPTMASGVQGSSPSTFATVATGNFVPPTATSIRFVAADTGSTGLLLVAPNTSYSYAGSAGLSGNPAPFQNNLSAGNGAVYGDLILESTNVFVIFSTATCVLNCIGWNDNI